MVIRYHKSNIVLDCDIAVYYDVRMCKFQHVDPKRLDKPPQWKSKGLKQRPHTVTVCDSQVYVKLSDSQSAYDSDYYSSEEYQRIMNNVKRK